MPWKPFDWPVDDPPFTFRPLPFVYHVMDMATWTTKGMNCPACNVLKGRTYPLGYWMQTIMPGWHDHCNCSLKLAQVGVLESPHDLWGTEPIWWNPQLTPGEYLANLFQRFLFNFNNREDADFYSGFDNLYPRFMSDSGFTTAGGTILGYKIRIQGFVEVAASYVGLLNGNKQIPQACLPWETSNKSLPNPKNPRFK